MDTEHLYRSREKIKVRGIYTYSRGRGGVGLRIQLCTLILRTISYFCLGFRILLYTPTPFCFFLNLTVSNPRLGLRFCKIDQ